MYKKLLIIVGILSLSIVPISAQMLQSTVNKCDNKKGPIIYTEFDCPEGYELVTDGWLNETNMTTAEKKDNSDNPLAEDYNAFNNEVRDRGIQQTQQ